jgi:hypothetical protein
MVHAFDSPPYPLAQGLIVDGANDRMIVRVTDQVATGLLAETWWNYQLSTGRELKRLDLKSPAEPDGPRGLILDAQTISGTPLILLHEWRYRDDTSGARFALINMEGKTVWERDLSQDYRADGKDDAQDSLLEEILANSAILDTHTPGQFTLRFVAENQRVTFAVAPEDGGNWHVTEVKREPYVAPVPEDAFKGLVIHPVLSDQMELHDPGPQTYPPIYKISGLVAAGPRRFAFLRWGKTPTLVVVNDRGEMVQTVSLARTALKEGDMVRQLLWQQGSRFLIFVERHSVQRERTFTEAYSVETRTGAISKVPGFRCPPIKVVAKSGEDGLVILATVEAKYTMKEEIYAYNSRWQQIWAIRSSFGSSPNDPPEALFSPESLTVLRNGTVAVLDVIRNTVQMYDRRGHYQKTLSLDKAWGHEASYPSDILADPNGGFVVKDSPGTPSVFWMTTSGKVLRRFTPHYPSGGSIEYPNLCMSADGHLFASDTYSIFRLDTKGRAEKRLGEAPNPDRLRDIVELVVCPNGRILAADERTNAVHVFDRQGHWLFVCKSRTAKHEVPSMFRSTTQQIELGPDGTFSIDGEWFDATGKPQAKPAGFRPVGARIAHLERRPDGSWLDNMSKQIVAEKGELAIVDGSRTLQMHNGNRQYLSLYSATDAPERVIPVPIVPDSFSPTLAYDGKKIVLVEGANVYCYRATGQPLWHFILPQEKASESIWTPFLTDAGHTLCIFNGQRTLYRYTMP